MSMHIFNNCIFDYQRRYSTDETNPDEEERIPYEILSKHNPKMNRILPASSKPLMRAADLLTASSHQCCQGGHHHH